MVEKADSKPNTLLVEASECVGNMSYEQSIADTCMETILRHNLEVKAFMASQLAEMGISCKGIERVLNVRMDDMNDLFGRWDGPVHNALKEVPGTVRTKTEAV